MVDLRSNELYASHMMIPIDVLLLSNWICSKDRSTVLQDCCGPRKFTANTRGVIEF